MDETDLQPYPGMSAHEADRRSTVGRIDNRAARRTRYGPLTRGRAAMQPFYCLTYTVLPRTSPCGYPCRDPQPLLNGQAARHDPSSGGGGRVEALNPHSDDCCYVPHARLLSVRTHWASVPRFHRSTEQRAVLQDGERHRMRPLAEYGQGGLPQLATLPDYHPPGVYTGPHMHSKVSPSSRALNQEEFPDSL
jgi:hypothetical protein